MKAGPRIATAVAVGYALGRTRKMKLAIAVGSMIAGRRLATNPRELLERGVERIASSPQMSRLTGEIRDQLLDAAKAAAIAAASNKIESLGDNLSRRAQAVRTQQPVQPSAAERPDEQQESVPKQREEEQRPAADRGGGRGRRPPSSGQQSRSPRETRTSTTSGGRGAHDKGSGDHG
jgi:hypothetical protein